MNPQKRYTTQLQAGLGLIEETKLLLEIWTPGMTSLQLQQAALESGRFPTITARRLKNIITEGFAPRYLANQGGPAQLLKQLVPSLTTAELNQFFLLFTSRANAILADFIRQVYWERYLAGYSELSNDHARAFVDRAIDDGKTTSRWSETTTRRMAGYLTGCCADFGLLEGGQKSVRRILTFHLSPKLAAYLAYDLHSSGLADTAVLNHKDWNVFGLNPDDVLEEMKRLSLKGFLITQSGGSMVRISWKYPGREALCDVLAQV
ncbi:MAG TPA: DUF1819 family protein [Acidobacteriota bacterium]|nr:DUF1819 family protein [Acidobacteriota bacterium]